MNGYKHRAGGIPSLLEAADLVDLDQPELMLSDGGQIWLAQSPTEIVGCICLRKEHGAWSLDKLAVAPGAQGQGIGRRLFAHAVAEARSRGLRQLDIICNSNLHAALNMYESFGCVRVPLTSHKYVTADIQLKLFL